MVYDAIVLGVGGMGSAACYHLASRGARVLGLERHQIGHDRGSSHGQTRLIRQAYFEGADYLPLLRRAYHLWGRLEREIGGTLFEKTGMVIFGPADGGEILPSILEVAHREGVPVEVLSPEDAATAYPGITPPPGYRGVLEPGAGFLAVEGCANAHATVARRKGAVLLEGVEVSGWKASESQVVVETTQGETYRGKKLIITAGAWAGPLLGGLSVPLRVHRQSVFWFPSDVTSHSGSFMPCFGFDLPDGFFYGVPAIDALGVKVAHHWPGPVVDDPNNVDRAFLAKDADRVLKVVSELLPGVRGIMTRDGVCMYTMTDDGHFIVDRHPGHPNVVFAAGFSGHGFKFAPVIGEIMADLALDGVTEHTIEFLRLRW